MQSSLTYAELIDPVESPRTTREPDYNALKAQRADDTQAYTYLLTSRFEIYFTLIL